jgi:GT2 family glycosyltransferase
LTEQLFPAQRFEVIVVDDGGRLPLEPVLAGFEERLTLALLSQPNAGPGAARNLGASQARGDFLAFTDDDCRPQPGWLEGLAQALDKEPRSICGGPTRNALVHDPFAQATQRLLDYVYQEYKPEDQLGAFFLTNNLALPRGEFLELGGFDTTLRYAEDRDLCHRWTSRGWPLVFAPRALVHHSHGLALPSFLRLHFQYGRGTALYKARCSQKGLPPARLSPLTYYLNLVLLGLRENKNAQGLRMSALLFASQAAYTAGYLWEKARGD